MLKVIKEYVLANYCYRKYHLDVRKVTSGQSVIEIGINGGVQDVRK